MIEYKKINLNLVFIIVLLIINFNINPINCRIQAHEIFNEQSTKSISNIIDTYFNNFKASQLGKKYVEIINKSNKIINTQSSESSESLESLESAESSGSSKSSESSESSKSSTTSESFGSNSNNNINEEKEDHIHGYNCKHDEFNHRFLKPKSHEHFNKITLPIKNNNKELLKDYINSNSLDDSNNNLDNNKQNKRFITTSTSTSSTAFQKPTQQIETNNKNLINNIFYRNSIRFFINNTFINGFNDKHACYKVGDIIAMGLTNDEPRENCRFDIYGEVSNVPCFYTCKEKDVLNKDLQSLLNEYVVKATFEIFSTLLSVRNPDKLLKLQKNPDDNKAVQCTRGIYIPEELYSKGKNNTDHYVFITSRPTQDSMTIAFSLICDAPILYIGTNEWIYDRPRVSILNFNPNYFSKILESQSKWVFNQYMRVGIHEMVHSLGFSALLYDSFVNPDTGIPYKFDSVAIAKVIQEDGTTPLGRRYIRSKSVISTPTVVKYTKNYFNCSTAQGFELEDYGGAGTAGSHWEKRSADEEIMTGYISQTLPLSRLTLTFLYDTGWYIPNFSFSETHQWGKGLGCDWLKNCDSKSWDSPGYYCTNFREMGCTANRMGKGICHLVRYTESLPSFYQHFNSTSVGGSNRASDYCPFYQNVHSVNCPKCGYCSNTEEKPNKSIKEEFGFESRCFSYNIIYINNDTNINNELLNNNGSNSNNSSNINNITNNNSTSINSQLNNNNNNNNNNSNNINNINNHNANNDNNDDENYDYSFINSNFKKVSYEKKIGCWVNRCNYDRKILEVKIDNNWFDCVLNKTIQVPIDVTNNETILLELICPKVNGDICDFN